MPDKRKYVKRVVNGKTVIVREETAKRNGWDVVPTAAKPAATSRGGNGSRPQNRGGARPSTASRPKNEQGGLISKALNVWNALTSPVTRTIKDAAIKAQGKANKFSARQGGYSNPYKEYKWHDYGPIIVEQDNTRLETHSPNYRSKKNKSNNTGKSSGSGRINRGAQQNRNKQKPTTTRQTSQRPRSQEPISREYTYRVNPDGRPEESLLYGDYDNVENNTPQVNTEAQGSADGYQDADGGVSSKELWDTYAQAIDDLRKQREDERTLPYNEDGSLPAPYISHEDEANSSVQKWLNIYERTKPQNKIPTEDDLLRYEQEKHYAARAMEEDRKAMEKMAEDEKTAINSMFKTIDPDNVMEQVWNEAERESSSEFTNYLEKEKKERASFSKSLARAGEGTSAAFNQALRTGTEAFAAHMKHHDIDVMSDAVWNRLGKEKQERLINTIAETLKVANPDASEEDIIKMAKTQARQYSDRRLYDFITEKKAPKDAADYLLRKIGENSVGSAMKGMARYKAGTPGDMAIEKAAMDQYAMDHEVLAVAGDVLKMTSEAMMYAGGVVGKGVTVGGTAVARGIFGDWVVNKGVNTLFGRMLQGSASSAANLFTYTYGTGLAEQFAAGGKIDMGDDGMYRVGDYDHNSILSDAKHSAMGGALVGSFGAFMGKYGNKIVQSQRSTAAKFVSRALVDGTGLVGEGIVFAASDMVTIELETQEAIKELANPESEAYEPNEVLRSVKEDELRKQAKERINEAMANSVAMVTGFKISHAVKGIPGFVGKFTDGSKSFETRFRETLDGERRDLGMTDDDARELEAAGYGSINDLFTVYKNDQKAQKNAKKNGGESSVEAPYGSLTKLIYDTNVSETTRAKVMYYMTGKMMPLSDVVNVGMQEIRDDNGNITGYTVEGTNIYGDAVTRKTFSTAERAEVEMNYLARQAEFGVVKEAEKFNMGEFFDKRISMACDKLSGELGVPVDILVDMMSRDPRTLNAVELEWVGRIVDEYKRMGDSFDYEAPKGSRFYDSGDPAQQSGRVESASVVRERIKKDTGIDVAKVLRKEPNRRTDKEHSALEGYVNELTKNRNSKGSQDKTRENYRRGYYATEEERYDIATARMSGDEGAESAYQGVLDRMEDDVQKNTAVKMKASETLQAEDGKIYSITIKTEEGGEAEVFVISGKLETKQDGSIDIEASDKTLAVYNPETNEKEMVSTSSVAKANKVISKETLRYGFEFESREEAAREHERMLGLLGFEPESKVKLPNDKEGTVLEVNGDIVKVAVADDEGKIVEEYYAKETLQDVADDARIKEYRARKAKEEQEAVDEIADEDAEVELAPGHIARTPDGKEGMVISAEGEKIEIALRDNEGGFSDRQWFSKGDLERVIRRPPNDDTPPLGGAGGLVEISEDEAESEHSRGFTADANGRRDIAIEHSMGVAGADAAWQGVVDQITEGADYELAKQRERVQQRQHTDGNYYRVTLKDTADDGRNKEAFIVDGKVVMLADGKGIDREASDKSVVVFDPATGEKKMIDPASDSGVLRVEEVNRGDDVESSLQQMRDERIQREIDDALGTVRVNLGDTVPLPDGSEGVFVGTMDAENNQLVVRREDGTMEVVRREDLQGAADASYLADYRARHPEAEFPGEDVAGAAAETPRTEQTEEIQEGRRQSQPRLVAPDEFEPGIEIVIRDDDGIERDAVVMGRVRYENGEYVPDADGNIIEYYSDGETRHEYMDGLRERFVDYAARATTETARTDQVEATGEPQVPMSSLSDLRNAYSRGASQPTSEFDYDGAVDVPEYTRSSASRDYEAVDVPEYTRSSSERSDYERMPDVPEYGYNDESVDQKGIVAKQTYDELSGRYGDKIGRKLDATVADRNSDLEKAKKDLQKAQDKYDDAPIGKEDKAEKDLRKAQAAYDAALEEKERWDAVKAEHDKVLIEKLRADKERRDREHDEAVAEVEAEIEAKKQAEEERAKVGNENPMPAITEKWDTANKIDGHRDEIVLPNGERVKGHYVLHEAGASSASHDANNGFQKTEGFPMDENGNTVNDRDYERDKEAQQITRDIARNYDQRALQAPVVVSRDGVVLSGNGRTMASEIAARENTDGAYIEYLKDYAHKYGFTPEQVANMQHPRVSFVPDESMPYTADTFAKFNQQEMKSQSKTEQAVKMGKVVGDNTYSKILRAVNNHATLGDFYADKDAVNSVINYLLSDGVVASTDMARLYDGESLSGAGKEFFESILIGKAFAGNPDVVRMLTEIKSLRQSVVTALSEINKNKELGEYSIDGVMADAITLAYKARKGGVKAGEHVSDFARQKNLFAWEDGETAADYRNVDVMLLGDVINSDKITLLKNVVRSYNMRAKDAADGIADIFTGRVKTKEELFDEIKQELGIEGYERKTNEQSDARTGELEEQGEPSGNGTSEDAVASGGDTQRPNGDRGENVVRGTAEGEGRDLSEDLAGEQGALAAAEQETNTEPTEAQKEAGNYKKGHLKIDGFDVTIENPKGSVRRGTDASGKQWEQEMQNTYGYIRGTKGVDGDHIDVFLSDDPSNGDVFVVDQVNKDGSFDEHKVMYGFPDIESARKAYLSNYEDGWQGLGAITPVSKEEFKKWIDSSHRKTKPFAEYSSVKPLGDTQLGEQPTAGYSIEPTTYTNKRGKITPMHLVKFDRELSRDEIRAGKELAKESRGWWDREQGGFMMRSEESAKELAEALAKGDKETIADAQPLSMSDMAANNAVSDFRAIGESIKVDKKPQATEEYDNSYEEEVYDNVLKGLRESIKDNNNLPDGKAIYIEITKLRALAKKTEDDLASLSSDKLQHELQTLAELKGRIKAYERFANEVRQKKKEKDRNEALAAHGLKLGDIVIYKGKEAKVHDASQSLVTLDTGEGPAIYELAEWGEVKLTNNKANEKKSPQPKKVNIEGLFGALKDKGEAKLSDHAEEVATESQRTRQENASNTREAEGFNTEQEQPKQEEPKTKSKWVDEEDADRFEELKRRLKDKLRGQMNMGVDPEIFSLGTQMAFMIAKHGARKFKDFAKAMIEEMGDGIRKHLKAFYNGARDTMEDSEDKGERDIALEMDDYNTVRGFDVYNFDKEGPKDIVETAKQIAGEDKAENEANEAKAKLKAQRNEQRKGEDAEMLGRGLRKATQEDLEGNPEIYVKGEERPHRIMIISKHGSQSDYDPRVFTKPVISSVVLTDGKSYDAKDLWVKADNNSESSQAVEKTKEKVGKSKKKSVTSQEPSMPSLFDGMFGDETKENSNEQEVHVQSRTGSPKREGGHQRGQNEPLGESKQHEDERPESRRVVRRGGSDSVSDTGRGSGVSESSDGKQPVNAAKPEPAPLAGSERKNTHNNHAERGTDYAPKSTNARIEANIAAIETMQRLIESGQKATPEDMSVLRKFSGWGGLGSAFAERLGWEANPINKRLRELLSPEAYEAANMSRNSAYYTPAPVIDAMWNVARAMGFRGGNVLEGSAGIGNIIGLMPTDMSERSNIHAVEIDETTGSILSLLYPDANVEVKGFEKTFVPNGSVDLAITNVPFVTGLRVMDETGDKDLSRKFHDIHDFCIAKNVRKLKEGGVGIFITSSGTLDSPNSAKLRTWLVNEGGADVVGAFRMHNQTFGGTGATSDIIVIRKRVNGRKSANAIDVSGTLPIRTVKYNTGETKRGSSEVIVKDLALDVNKHFVEHPEDMAGEMAFAFEKGDTYRATSKALYPSPSINQEQRLSEWAQQLKDMDWDKAEERESQQVVYEDLGEDVKEGSMLLDSEGNLCLAQRGKAVPINVNANKVKGHTKAECFNAYKAIKDALADVLEYQTAHSDDSGLQQRLAKLNKAYDSFVKTYGHLNKNTSISFLRSDMDYPSIAALESVSEKGDKSGKRIVTYGKTDIFSRRVVETESEPKPTSIKDGIIASIYLNGRVDVPYIADQLNMSDSDVRQQVIESGLGFENPTTTEMEVSYEYLSGNVREKLRQAQENNTDGRYDANIKALERVIPMNIPAHLIEFTLGSSWVDPKLYEDYVRERTGLDVTLSNVGGTWLMNEPFWTNTEQNKAMGVISEKCDKTILGHELIKAAITCKSINVTKTVTTGYGRNKTTETIVDKDATIACANKVDEIRQDFKDWARGKMQSDAEMSERMERVYNDLFNNSVPKEIPDEFVPEHFGGAATVVNGNPFKLRPHQAKAVIRATTQPLMLAHEVGTGKTYTLISTAMEMRRLGTARKPMIVVQNATVGQFVASAKALYPNAKILTLEDADRNAEGRRNFYAKIRYNDWDMIVVPQSVFERIPDSEERQIRFVEDKIEEKMAVLEKMREAADNDRDPVLRQAQRELEQLEEERNNLQISLRERKGMTEKDEKREAKTRQNAMVKAQEMLDRETDDVANFDDMGIDALLIDEAHEYKHLGFATAMQRGVKGVDPSYSKKSQGVYLKTQAVLESKNGKNVVFATGTPISNTAAEIWTFMRYLMPADTLRDYGIYYFDDFVRNFGSIEQRQEFSTNGKYKENNRFAGYTNIPELVRIWSGVADTVLTREAGGVSDKIPKTESGKAQDIYLPQTRALRGVMKYVKAELDKYDKMSGKEKKENSHIPLVMYGIAKAAAVDARLVLEDAADEPNSKTNEAVRQTLRSLEDTKEYDGTVAIFADNYQNKATGFNLYEDIRKKLIDAGVPETQVVVMKSGMSIKKKLEIFDKVNRGEVRVIMGSTFTLGTGVNIQERLHTLIHVDAPNRPMDYTQRNGRILRQGNLHNEWGIPVRVLRFGVEDSLDVTAYQRLKTKGAIADSIMEGKKLLANSMVNRVLEEEQDLFGDITAQLSGSQYALLKNQVEKEVRKLEAREKQWEADQTYVHNQIPRLKGLIKDSEDRMKQNKAALAKVEGVKIDGITIGKTKYPTLESMSDYIKDYNSKQREQQEDVRKSFGSDVQAHSDLTVNVGGFDFNVHRVTTKEQKRENGQLSLSFSAKTKMTYSCEELGLKDVPVEGQRLKSALEDIVNNVMSGRDFREKIVYAEQSAERYKGELQQVEARNGKPFEYVEDLKKAKEKLAEYEELMKAEMAEKEAKYAEMDADVESASGVKLTDEDSEGAEDSAVYSDGESKNPIWKDFLDVLERASASRTEVPDIIKTSSKSDVAKIDNNSKIKKDLSEIIDNIDKKSTYSPNEFIGQLAISLGLRNVTSDFSNYKEIVAGGKKMSVRVSNHYGNAIHFEVKGRNNATNYGIVIKTSNSRFRPSDNVNYLEFVYYGDHVNGNADLQKAITKGIRTLVSDGSITGMPEPNRLNSSGIYVEYVKKVYGESGFLESKSGFDSEVSLHTQKRERVEQLGERLQTPIRIVDDVESIGHKNADIQARRRKAKGWYDKATGEVVVVLPNNKDVEDVSATVAHETIAHKGLREMIGEERYDEFLDEVYKHLRADLKNGVDDVAGRAFLDETLGVGAGDEAATMSQQRGQRKSYEERRREAVDELFGRLAEKPFDEFSEGERTLWQRIKAVARRVLDKFLGSLKLPKWFELGDNELRYMLWRSKERLEKGKEHPIDVARDIAKREELGLGKEDTALYNDGEAEVSTDMKNLWGDRSLSLEERTALAASRLSELHKEDEQKRNDAVAAIGTSLKSINRLLSQQRGLDGTTVKRVTDLARVLISTGHLSSMSDGEVMRLVSAISKSLSHKTVGSDKDFDGRDMRESVTKVMDIMVDNQLKQGRSALESLTKIKGSKVDARGVEVQGSLDPEGTETIKVFKTSRRWDTDAIEEAMADATDRMGSDNKVVADNAAVEYAGLELAMDYADNIKASEMEEAQLRGELKRAHDESDREMRKTDAYNEYVSSLEEAIRKNKIERAESYYTLVGRMSDSLRESMANASAFREAEKERINQIHHYANSDLLGKDAGAHRTETTGDKIRNTIADTLLNPTMTFEQFMRFFGSRTADGEGYLFKHFMRGLVDARDKEIQGVRGKFKVLDDKVHEMFGKKAKSMGDLIGYIRKLPKMDVEFFDGNEKVRRELNQGNLMYIYMVDKMLDGRMKLRNMGISEEDVDIISSRLDPRLRAFADWVQDEFLVETREEYNETHKRMFGASMAAIDDYFPLKILGDARHIDEDLDKNDGLEMGTGTTVTGAVKKRTRNALALDIMNADALHVLLDHVAEMEHWNAYAEWGRDLNTLLSYGRFRNRVKNMKSIYGTGDGIWDNFKTCCRIAAGSFISDASRFEKGFLSVARGATAACISFRLNTALKQLLSLPAVIPELNARAMLEGIINPTKPWNWCMENLPQFQERWLSRRSGDPRLQKTEMGWNDWRNNIVEKAARFGMTPNAFVDAVTVSVVAYNTYKSRKRSYLKDVYDEARAEKLAKQDATMSFNLSQQSSEGAYLSPMQADKHYLQVLFTIFRNASQSYTRQVIESGRGLKRAASKSQREVMLETMKKQYMRDGFDEAQAETNARRKLNRQIRRDLLRQITFGYVLPGLWSMGGYWLYLAFGNNDEEKDKMKDDIMSRLVTSPFEGVMGGDVLSNISSAAFSGDWSANKLTKEMPISGNIEQMLNKFFVSKDTTAGINDLINLMVMVGVGVNPKTVEDMVVGVDDFIEVCGGDVDVAREALILSAYILNSPKSQINKLYIDELGMSGEEASRLTPEQIADRYARMQVKLGRPLMPWAWNDESQLEKGRNKAMKDIKGRVGSLSDESLRSLYDSNDDMKKLAGGEVAKRLGGSDSFGSSKSAYNQEYVKHRDYVDLAEDVALQNAKKDAKAKGNEDLYKEVNSVQNELTKMRKELIEEGVNASDVMRDIRAYRREKMNELGL